MTLQSAVPSDVSPAQRLREYYQLVRELSEQSDPQSLINTYRRRAQFVVHNDGFVALSKRNAPAGCVRITRASMWDQDVNPWKQPDKLPLIERGVLTERFYGGRPIKIDDLRVAEDDPFVPYVEGMRSLIAVPVFDAGAPNYMTVSLRREAASFSLEDLATALLTSNLVSRATSQLLAASEMERLNKALEREFNAVGEVQRELLPRQIPAIPGVKIAAYYETSQRAGGDYYDVCSVDESRFAFLIADVSGHGPAAAVVTGILHALFKTSLRACGAADMTPSQVLARLNEELFRSTRMGQFVTAFLAFYAPRTRRLEYASAGHNPPRWLRAGESKVYSLDADDGIPLGVVDDFSCSDSAITVDAGDRLLLYTDGITETFNTRREMFGTEGLDRILACCSRAPELLVDAVRDEVNLFAMGAPAADDRTLLAIAFDD